MTHPPSREELERVWQSERVGWLKDYNKNTRGKQPYTIVAKPYRKQYLNPVEITIWAKSPQGAMKHTWELSQKVREKYPYDEHKDIAWEYGYKK